MQFFCARENIAWFSHHHAAHEPTSSPRTRRERRATADLVAFLTGTGVGIDEARRLCWDQIDLNHGRVYVRRTRSEASDR